MDAVNPSICQQSPPATPFIRLQALPTLLKTIAIRKCAYPTLIVHSPKRLWRTQEELIDAINLSIYQHICTQTRFTKEYVLYDRMENKQSECFEIIVASKY